jgi:PAS domain S-box-containing protein
MVLKIAEDSLGNLWLATDVGLIYFDRINNKIIQYTHDPKNPESLSDDNVETVLIDKNNRLWVTTQKGLNLFLSETGTFKHITRIENNAADLSKTYFMDMAEDREGNLWFGSTVGLFCLKNNAENKITPLIHYQYNSRDKNSLSINRVKSLFVDDTGNLWIGTENGGVNLFDRKNQRFWHYRKDEYDPKSLNNESIQAIYQDKTGNLWVCTFTGGINVAANHSDAIIHYQTLPGAPLSLSHNVITCFLEDHLGQIWVGTDGGGLNLFNAKTNRFLRFNMDNSHLSSNAILCLFEDSNNQIWLGTWAGGLVRFDSKTKSFTPFTTKNSGIQDDNIYAIAEGDHDDLWLGSFENGLIHYQIKEKKFTNYTPSNSGLVNKMIVKIKKFSKGRLFIGSTNCFQIFSPDDERFTTYIHDPNNPNSLSHSSILDILVENDSCVWIGTQNGLNRFNPKAGSFKRYYEKDGLPNNVIKGLVLDKSGVLWMTTNNGVCRFDYKQEKFKNFTKADGLQSNEFSYRSVLKTKNGALLMGGTNGFNMVFPEKIAENMNTPQVLITDFFIFNEPVKIGVEGSPLKRHISETKQITISYKQSVLTFYFAVMDFSMPEKNQYAYKMEGFDKDWIYSGNKREATYTNLDPGEYTFRVKGSNNDGIWNEEGTSIRITITPPFSKTIWFKLILLAAIVGVVFWVYKWREQIRDLAEERRVEVVLANERNMLRSLIDHVPDNIFVKDSEGRFVIVNTAQAGLLGAAVPDELTGKTDFDFYPKELADLYWADEQAIFRSDEPLINKEESNIDAKGNQKRNLTTKVPLHDNNGKVIGLVGISRDISERQRMEVALQRSEERFRALFDQAAVGVAQIETATGRFLKVNRRVCDIVGYAAGELESLTFQDITHSDDLPADMDNMKLLAEGKISEYSVDKRFRRKDGSLVWVNQTVSTMSIDREKQSYEITVVQDITARKQMEERIRTDIKEKETLLKEIHHRVKNNMQVIVSLLRLQADQIEDPDILEKFKASEDRIASMALVHEMLYGSKDLSKIDFNRYIENLVNTLFQSFGVDTDRIGLVLNLEPIQLDVYDAIPCGLVVQELVSNSLKYAFPKDWKGEAKIRIGLRRVDDKVELSVADTGKGMPEITDVDGLKSLGFKLVHVLGKEQLDGDVQVNRENGTRITVRFKENQQSTTP